MKTPLAKFLSLFAVFVRGAELDPIQNAHTLTRGELRIESPNSCTPIMRVLYDFGSDRATLTVATGTDDYHAQGTRRFIVSDRPAGGDNELSFDQALRRLALMVTQRTTTQRLAVS